MARISKSKAAKFNAHTLQKLQDAVEIDPEVDLTTKLPSRYSARLTKMRRVVQSDNVPKVTPKDEDIRAFLRASDSVEIVFSLSEAVLNLLGIPRNTASTPNDLSERLVHVVQASEIIWKAPFARQKMVINCGHNIAVKAVRAMEDHTEYTTLKYIQQHKPSIPAPEPQGLVKMGDVSLIFMTHIPSNNLTDVWPSMDSAQKVSVKEQLSKILMDIRSLPYATGTPFGGVGGEGCKDIRRHLRRSDRPITTVSEFEDFLFTGPHPGGQIFVKFLRQLSPQDQPSSSAIVFTHGDLRPDNIVVKKENNEWIITGLLDWEYSGFYPEYYEAIKSTNCLGPYEENDWFLFLPDCISPTRYTHWWLLDRVRETRLV
ncbi:hypothetical protein AJ80_09498 [Polytolypa hystricis UAMH7299]|uniref:Aminoglycoside phosphotransferase domain-containing protein n=1 Tax=Polytolypa hystricis (strain UAMH7299) TaxID=1447883 RepID=A0A2B7WQ96_POLH7|nr:hypothetical protein AJ80_09498 [Polytolypa hystricis UAMH7299]